MDEDIVARMEAEEADLAAKLEAVRQFLAVYRGKAGARAEKPSARAASNSPRPKRSQDDRLDKFGPYGQRIVDTVTNLLPGNGGNPVPTRRLVDQLGILGVEITGNNKVNSLSALLARSSKIKGYGRAGWTLQSETPGELYPRILDGTFQKENEPHSEEAGGSDAVSESAPTLELTEDHSIDGTAA